ncbi:MAG: sodium:solute symporter [Bacteroidota bacterium]|nr:sodium:solute symporter [Bacteroidota bacterium]
MHLSLLDFFIIAASLGAIAVFGVLRSGKQNSVRDYFLSDSAIPWWSVCFAVVATETSALTFLSLPGVAYTTDITFLQLAIGYIIGRILVARFFLPRYFEGTLETAYTYLERRFGSHMRRTASIAFLGTRFFADGVRLYATAIPLALFLRGANITAGLGSTNTALIAIAVVALLTTVYVYLGGVRAVIWTDVIQFFVYIIGAIAALTLVTSWTRESWSAILSTASSAGKFRVIAWGFDGGIGAFFTRPHTAVAGIIGGMFLSMASHGTDHLIIQRLLATNRLPNAQRALVGSGIVVFIQFALFLILGAMLWIFYQGSPQPSNEVFSRFILENIPSGLRGFIIAGVLAAAMSTLSGSISALSSSTILDIVGPLMAKKRKDGTSLRQSRAVSVLWSIVLIASAALFIGTPTAVVELALGIASYTYGALLGVYLLGVFFRGARERSAMIGFATSLLGTAVIILTTDLAWTWYIPVGTTLCIASATVAEHGSRESTGVPSIRKDEVHGNH